MQRMQLGGPRHHFHMGGVFDDFGNPMYVDENGNYQVEDALSKLNRLDQERKVTLAPQRVQPRLRFRSLAVDLWRVVEQGVPGPADVQHLLRKLLLWRRCLHQIALWRPRSVPHLSPLAGSRASLIRPVLFQSTVSAKRASTRVSPALSSLATSRLTFDCLALPCGFHP